MKKGLIIIVVIVVIVVACLAWWLLQGRKDGNGSGSGTENIPQAESGGLGAQIYEKADQNPASAMPDTNPFKTDINPYNNAYKNPFGQ